SAVPDEELLPEHWYLRTDKRTRSDHAQSNPAPLLRDHSPPPDSRTTSIHSPPLQTRRTSKVAPSSPHSCRSPAVASGSQIRGIGRARPIRVSWLPPQGSPAADP